MPGNPACVADAQWLAPTAASSTTSRRRAAFAAPRPRVALGCAPCRRGNIQSRASGRVCDSRQWMYVCSVACAESVVLFRVVRALPRLVFRARPSSSPPVLSVLICGLERVPCADLGGPASLLEHFVLVGPAQELERLPRSTDPRWRSNRRGGRAGLGRLSNIQRSCQRSFDVTHVLLSLDNGEPRQSVQAV